MQTSNLFLLFIVTSLISCKKWDLDQVSFPVVTTGETEVQENLTATLYGEINGLLEQEQVDGTLEPERVDNHGHLWTIEADDPLELPHLNRTSFGKAGNESFQSEIPNIAFDQIYYYRSYAQMGRDIFYGDIKEFNIGTLMITMQIDNITLLKVKSSLVGQVEIDLTYSNWPVGLIIDEGGIAMSSQPAPTIDQFSDGEGPFFTLDSSISFTLTLTVDIDKVRYFRPYANINGQIFYGKEMFFDIPDFWVKKADFKGGIRHDAVGFSIGNKGYIGTGCDDPIGTGCTTDGVSKKDFWEYNPSTDEWTQKADLAGGTRVWATGFSIGNKGYIGLGLRRDDFWEYNPETNKWRRRADFLGDGRYGTVGFSIGNKGYIGTGRDGDNIERNDFWEYDPDTDQWTKKANFAGGSRRNAVGFSIGDKGYIGTGWPRTNDFWEYDPSTDQWTKKADFCGSSRLSAVGFSIEERGYIGTGDNSDDEIDTSDFWEYIPEL